MCFISVTLCEYTDSVNQQGEISLSPVNFLWAVVEVGEGREIGFHDVSLAGLELTDFK